VCPAFSFADILPWCGNSEIVRPIEGARMSNRFQIVITALLCTVSAGAAQAQQQLVTDMKLEDSGFVMRRADTPDKLRRAQLLPSRQFVARVKDGKRYYLYADTELCKCVFVGSPDALRTFRDLRRPQQADNVMPSGMSPTTEVIDDLADDRWNLIGGDDFLDYNY
jgi:hypothetical protein